MPQHVTLARSRRDFRRLAGCGFGSLAFSALAAAEDAKTQINPFSPKAPHFPTKCKSVVFLFMEGGPSHLDLFDPKPELNKRAGQPLPESFGKIITPMGTGGNKLLASKRKWAKHVKAGLDIADWLPNIAKHADDLCLLRGC